MSGHGQIVTVHLRIEGKVQGVWYRAWTEKAAAALGLDGWVRNRQDGTVEAVLKGPMAVVEQMVTACHDGPTDARVTAVIATPAPHEDVPAGFHRRATL
ncbi:acylphosphatase [Insolitispirillum peregrinum]